MITNPHIVRRRLVCLYRKLISLWVDDSEITNDVHDEFLSLKNSDEIKTFATAISIKPGVIVIKPGPIVINPKPIPIPEPITFDKIEAGKDPLWIKYIGETIAVAKINENDGVLPVEEPVEEPIVVEEPIKEPPIVEEPIGKVGKLKG